MDESRRDEASSPLPIRRREFIIAGSVVGVTGCTGDVVDDAADATDDDSSDIDDDDGEEERERYEPAAVLLAWQRDPTATMTIDWHSEIGDEVEPTLQYRRADESAWLEAMGQRHGLELYSRDINRVELDGLDGGTDYEFRFGAEPIYRFRTLPKTLDREIRFAVGGDADGMAPDWSDWARVASETMGYDLDFFLIGGDFAYANGGASDQSLSNWYNWLDVATERLIDADNRVVPIVACIGNHECKQFYYFEANDYEDTDEWRESFAPYFYSFFAFPGQPGYDVLDVGEYLSIPILDSDHTNPIDGEQTAWLEDVLAERTNVEHVLPTYHVAGWPSVRTVQGRSQIAVRENWVPLFEEYDVRMAFEHHDHAFNITYPIRDGEVDPTGVVYMGDGPLGHSEREPVDDRWFIYESAVGYNADVVSIDPDGLTVTSIDDEGNVMQEVARDGEEYTFHL